MLTHDIEELLKPEPREGRLTPWIRDKLSSMRMRLRELEALRAENERLRYLLAGKRAAAEGEGADTWFEDDSGETIALGKGTAVSFGPSQELTASWDAGRKCLLIDGGDGLALCPESSFTVRVSVIDG